MQQTSTKVYKPGNNWVGKVFLRELRKRLEFDHTTMYKPGSVLKNETYKILKDLLVSAKKNQT